MRQTRYFSGLSEITVARREHGRETPAAAEIHAFVEGESQALCGAHIVHRLPENFEQSVGGCRPCGEQVLASR